jgi:uncharacterized protein YwqG
MTTSVEPVDQDDSPLGVTERALPLYKVAKHALAPYREALETTRRPVVNITLEQFPADDLQVSKVGGRAWWPVDEAPPSDEHGSPLVMLAQINFAEVPATPGYPDRGLLQFFIGSDDYYCANFDDGADVESLSRQCNFRVVYWTDLSQPGQAVAIPVEADSYSPDEPTRPRRMRFDTGSETLSAADYRTAEMFGGSVWHTLEERAEQNGHSEDAVGAVMEILGGPGHKLGGYPYFTQTDPRIEGPMELLLQLDSDDEMMWGDAGVGGFFIDPADLARADFSRVMYNWDCH